MALTGRQIIKKEYMRQRRRIQAYIRRNEKKGFIFKTDTLPEIPKRITSGSIRRLEKLTPEKLLQKSKYIDMETGEIIPGKQGKKLIQQESKQRRRARILEQARPQEEIERPQTTAPPESIPNGADIIISNFRYIIGALSDAAYSLINDWLNEQIAIHGKEAVAIMIEEATEAGAIPEIAVSYNTTLLLERLSEMLSYLPLNEEEQKQWNQTLNELESWDNFE